MPRRRLVYLARSIALVALLALFTLHTSASPALPPPPAPLPPSLFPGIPAAPLRLPTPRESLGTFGIDLPDRIDLNQHFSLDLWLEPTDPEFRSSVQVFMEQTDKVVYDPRVLDLTPGRRLTVGARVRKSRSGLAEIIASASGWKTLFVSVDVGFLATFSSKQLADPIEGGTTRSFTLDIVDGVGKPISLDAPISLIIQASRAKVRQRSDEPWSNSISAHIRRGATATPIFELSPSLRGGKGLLQVEARINEDRTILTQALEYTVVLPWWLLLGIAIGGGLLYAPYHSAGRPRSRRARVVATLGILALDATAGVFAYLAATLNLLEVVGLNVDTSRPQGFFLLGFLFAHVGVERIIKRFKPEESPQGPRAPEGGEGRPKPKPNHDESEG